MEEDVEEIITDLEYLKASGKLSLISVQVVSGNILEDVKYVQRYKIVLNEVVRVKIDEPNIFKRLINRLRSREYINKEVISERTVSAFIQDLEKEKKVTESTIGGEGNTLDLKYYKNFNNYEKIVVILGKKKDSWNTVIKLPSLIITLMDKSTGFIEKQTHYFETEEEMNKVVDFIIKEDSVYCVENKRKSNLNGIKDEIKDVYTDFKNLCKDGK